MDVGDVKVTDENGVLSCRMMVKAMNTMKERPIAWPVICVSAFASRPASEIDFQPLHPDTGAQSASRIPPANCN